MELNEFTSEARRYYDIYETEGRGFYDALNHMCAAMAGHTDLSAVLAKVSIIGEMYRTRVFAGIDSDTHATFAGEDRRRVLARQFVSDSQKIDGALQILGRIPDRPGAQDLLAMARSIGAIEESAQKVAMLRKNSVPRRMVVFASKYAQSHAPNTIVMDQFAESTAYEVSHRLMQKPWSSEVGRALEGLWNDHSSKLGLRAYVEHLVHFTIVHDHLCANLGKLSVKATDFILYNIGRDLAD